MNCLYTSNRVVSQTFLGMTPWLRPLLNLGSARQLKLLLYEIARHLE